MTAALLVAFASPAYAAVTPNRIDGATRYETAVEISNETFPMGSTAVVIATGTNFPDALTGGIVGAADFAPMLLVSKTVPAVVKAEINRLGASHAYILGGPKAVPDAVEDELAGMGLTTQRIYGANRYETAAEVAYQADALLPGGVDDVAIVATGENFPDSLAGSPLSGWGWMPILLVNKNSIPDATEDALTNLGINHTIILGGSAAVSNAVKNQLPDPIRLGGANRYETMRLIGEFSQTYYGMGMFRMSLATGQNYPDALAGGVRCGLTGSILVLTPTSTLCDPAQELLLTRKGLLTDLECFGGTKAVNTSVFNQAVSIAE